MNRKQVVDFVIFSVCLAALGVVWVYFGGMQWQEMFLWVSGVLAVIFLALGIADRGAGAETERSSGKRPSIPSESELITELVLLSEEDTELMVWGLYGKTALVIGRDIKENQVDVDLGQGPYASMVDIEHAVLNFSNGNWYVEDLGSVNGLSVKKAQDGRNYRLSADTPCRLERGDCIYAGLNRLLLR